ncbi:MAG TPA: hypothetical protein VF790_09355 [Dissulfurispiraceae bacterium]
MKRIVTAIMLLALVGTGTFGCSTRGGSAAAGALGGAAIGAGAYEYKGHRDLQKLEEDYKAGRINKQEYEIRKDQIEKEHLLK